MPPQVKAADIEQGILDILQDARGRGKDGLTEEQQEALAASVDQLEAIGGLKVTWGSHTPLFSTQRKMP